MGIISDNKIDDFLKDVQKRLDKKSQNTHIKLKVEMDGYVRDDDWLHIVVSPAQKGIRAYQYVEALSEVEKELRADGIDNVLLVPAMGD